MSPDLIYDSDLCYFRVSNRYHVAESTFDHDTEATMQNELEFLFCAMQRTPNPLNTSTIYYPFGMIMERAPTHTSKREKSVTFRSLLNQCDGTGISP